MNISPFEEIKILSCYDKIKQILDGKLPTPRTAEVYLSNRCNHSCLGCHSKILHHLNPAFMSFKKFKKIINQLASLNIEGIEISGGGEPLLNPDFIDMVKYSNSKKIKVGLITNGIEISEKMGDELIDNLSFIRIAFDAAKRQTYERVHQSNDYPRLLNNIRLIVNRKRRKGADIKIGLKFLISKINYKEIVSASKIATELGVDYLQFKAMRNSPYEISKVLLPKVEDLILKSKDITGRYLKIFGTIRRNPIKSKCYLTPLHPCIDVSGKVYLCNYFQYRMNTHMIGDIDKNTFREIWFSEYHKKAVDNIKIRECNLYDCFLGSLMNIADETIIKDKMQLEFI